MRRLALLLVLGVSLTGCSWISGIFGGKDNAAPPAPLTPLKNEIAVNMVWHAQLGNGNGKQYVKLRPAVDGDRVFAAARDGRVAAYAAADGKRIWEVKTKAPISGGVGVGGGLVLVGTTDAQVIALDEKDGKQVWRANVSSEVLARPQEDSGVVVVQTVDGKVAGLSAEDGHRLWIYDRTVPVLSLRGTATPDVVDGGVLAGFASGKLVALTLQQGRAIWESTVAVPTGRSELERMVDVDSSPVVVDGVIYAVTYQGRAAAIEQRTGRLLWARDMSSYAGLGVAGNAVYVTDAGSHVWALDRRSGASLWKQSKLHDRSLTAPVPFGDYVAVGDYDGYLHLLAQSDGHLAARLRVDDSRILAPPLQVGNTLYVQSADGRIVALRLGGTH